MSLRPYQHEFIGATLAALCQYDRVLGVAATGAGKTVMAGEIVRRSIADGPVLFLADAQELVKQAADKLEQWSGIKAGVEMAEEHAAPGDTLVVATTQSIARRLEKWPADYFRLIIVDEAHRNTLGQQAQQVLGHFAQAQVIGITATPFRSDKQQLGTYYQSIASEIGLVRLIREGFLARITIKSVPSGVDIREVRTQNGDYRSDDLGAALDPHLATLAGIVKQHAAGRRTVAFLPLRDTSRRFVEACRAQGLRAVHVDGEDREGLEAFRAGKFDIIANASLLTTGWDEPSVDCVTILRPTKSFVLYSQMVGRGTRIHPGKRDLLLLDPLFLADGMSLIRPARLIAKTAEEADDIQRQIDGADGEQIDLLGTQERAAADREKRMRQKLEDARRRKARTVDAIEFALSLGKQAEALRDYEPEQGWEMRPPSEKQLAMLERNGFDLEGITSMGLASKLIDLIFRRREQGLASPKQVFWLGRMGHPAPDTATFEEARDFLDRKFGGRNKRPGIAA